MKSNDFEKLNEALQEVREDYMIDTSVFTEVDDRILGLNWDALSPWEKDLLFLYAEIQSYRKVANLIGVSHTSAEKYLTRIRKKLCSI